MDAIYVPGATGYIDTNYEGKADAAVDALSSHDFVFLHVEAIDEVSHAGDLRLKIDTIEQFDSRVVTRVLAGIGSDVAVAVLPDHPVPVSKRKHTRVPVPVAVRMPERPPDGVTAFNEIDCLHGALGRMVNGDLMALLFH
jgi:2,3-bisphosphoglycerate-independent phosphoglycerate mutase